MELINSTRGGFKLCFEGYTYTKIKENRTTKHWKCSGRHKYNCMVTIKTKSDVSEVLEGNNNDVHTHGPDFVAIEALKVRNRIKANSRTNRGKPSQILADHMANQPIEVIVRAGSRETIKRQIRRQQIAGMPEDSTTMNDIIRPNLQNESREERERDTEKL